MCLVDLHHFKLYSSVLSWCIKGRLSPALPEKEYARTSPKCPLVISVHAIIQLTQCTSDHIFKARLWALTPSCTSSASNHAVGGLAGTYTIRTVRLPSDG